MKNPFLIGQRLYFRPLEREDASIVLPWVNDPEVRAFLRRCRPVNLSSEIEYIDKINADENAVALLLVLKDGDRPIGMAGLNGIDPRNRKAEFGIAIGDRSCWGQGLGREATQLMLEHAFSTLNLHRVALYVYEHNERAIRCYEKLGFQKEGTLRQDHFHDGRYWDTLVMGMLCEEWKAVRVTA